MAPAPADVATLVDEARSRFQSGGGRNNLRIDLPPELPLVMADGRRIIQVLNNLLTNAARHSHEASAIGVSAVREGYHVAVSVTDEGRGIAAERLPHLFRKFSRIDGEERGRDIAGSGLGLAICKGIVEAHGGRIWAESDGPGLGARFTFTIPVAQDAAIGAAHLPVRPRRSERERERILAVDDDPQTLRYVRDALARAGYAPIVTGDPQEATSLVRANDPHLVLLDLMLPGTDGIELMGDILNMADVPVIFLSAYGQDEVVARAFDMGAADYVVKPFSPTELVARIRAALRKREAPEWAEPPEPYVRGDLTVDYARRRVTVAGNPVALTPIEYRMLVELSVQGEFLDYVTRDVYEFALAIRMEAARRWTVASSLIRPLQERSEYALAAAIDSSFRDRYVEYINTQIDKKFTASSRKRPLVQIARGAINRWAKESHGKDGLLETSITLNKIGSDILHHGIGFSGEAKEIVEVRPWLLRMASGRVQCGMANVMLAIKVMGGNDTDAWRRALAIVTLA